MEADRDGRDERDARRSRLVAGYLLGFGTGPLVGVAIYALASLFVESSLALVVVVAACIVSFGLGLFYVALARTLEA